MFKYNIAISENKLFGFSGILLPIFVFSIIQHMIKYAIVYNIAYGLRAAVVFLLACFSIIYTEVF